MSEIDWDRIRYFTEDEMRCKCGCGTCEMDAEFMLWLDALREDCGFPLPVNSGYRCPDHDTDAKVHRQGKGADLGVSGKRAHALIRKAMRRGVRGVGVKQTGPHEKRFVHLDRTYGETRPWVWSYDS